MDFIVPGMCFLPQKSIDFFFEKGLNYVKSKRPLLCVSPLLTICAVTIQKLLQN